MLIRATKALLELKNTKEQCELLLRERDDNEKEVLEFIKKNTYLKQELSNLHSQYSDIIKENVELKSIVDSFDHCRDEGALKLTAELKVKLNEAQDEILSLRSEKLDFKASKAQCLFKELVGITVKTSASTAYYETNNFGCIELFEGGQHRQHTAMMVMAMLGFYFEVSRHDRDKYIRVHMRHIRPDKIHHFEKIRSDATLSIPYDYKSATHPAWQFWRKVGKTGISTVATYKDQDPDGTIMKSLGQNEELLSNGDILKINSVYGVQCFKNKHRSKLETQERET